MTLDSPPNSEEPSQRNLAYNETYRQPSTLKQMDYQNERINGWNNTYDW